MNNYQRCLRVLRAIYDRLFVEVKDDILKTTEVPNSLEDVHDRIYELISCDKACMICRYGAFELSTFMNGLGVKHNPRNPLLYVLGRTNAWWWSDSLLEKMQSNAGFFPATYENALRFTDLMLEDTKQVDVLGIWRKLPDEITQINSNIFVSHLVHLEPWWSDKPWTRALSGKKVLAVHPFAGLILEQYQNHREFLFEKKDVLPVFHLETIPAIQSIGGESNGFKNWFEALDYMKSEIDKRDYDICLLGCGAYGFPLAAHVKRQGKKAVHLGGALQLLFGIGGRRWNNPNYGAERFGLPVGSYAKMFNDYWIYPGEQYKPQRAEQVEGGCYW